MFQGPTSRTGTTIARPPVADLDVAPERRRMGQRHELIAGANDAAGGEPPAVRPSRVANTRCHGLGLRASRTVHTDHAPRE